MDEEGASGKGEGLIVLLTVTLSTFLTPFAAAHSISFFPPGGNSASTP
jgi:hypothetical protein